MMSEMKQGTYTYNDDNLTFKFYTDLPISKKLVFVNSVVDTIVSDDSYNSVIRDLMFDYMVVKVFTDVDMSFIQVKDEFNNDKVKRGIKESLEALLGVIPGLVEIKVQTEKLESSKNADVMLYSVFESEKALKDYAVHPAHVEVADGKVRPYMASRSCLDFDTHICLGGFGLDILIQ